MIHMKGAHSKVLGHLGLVAGMYDKLGIGTLLNKLIPTKSEDRIVDTGTCVKALILNGLGFFERRLYLVSHFFEDKPIAQLLGSDIEASMLNDDRLGRCLDELYEAGLSEVFQQISGQVVEVLGLQSSYLHLDSSSFHVDGAYNSEAGSEDGRVIHITKGYSRDHRPDLNQVILNLVVEHESGIPLRMEALSGNASDKETFRQTIESYISNMENTPQDQVWVADSALYTSNNLEQLSGSVRWVSRVPETIKEASELISQVDASQLKAYAGEDFSGYQYLEVCSQYSGVKQRWFLIFSQAAYDREIATLTRRFAKESEKECKLVQKAFNEQYSCLSDAQRAADKLSATMKHGRIHDLRVQPIKQYPGKGRPSKEAVKEIVGYQLTGAYCCDRSAYEELCRHKGRFILATNILDERVTPEELLTGYKSQSKVERGFRFLKDKQFMANTLYVKNPNRVEAILMIMGLCLMVYACLERQLRKALVAHKETVTNQVGKQVQNPTMKWVFSLFKGVHLLYLPAQEAMLLNLEEELAKIARLLGPEVGKYYQNG